MRFTQDSSSGTHIIRSYGDGGFRIDDQSIRGGVIVSATAILVEPEMRGLADLTPSHVARVLAMNPEVVLFGTGARQQFPAPTFGARFLGMHVGFEVMDSGAACRTFNVLVAEQRRAVAILLP